MSTPTTKVAIHARRMELNEQLKLRPRSAVSQQDERHALIDSCHDNGGHVPESAHDGSNAVEEGFFFACGFCGVSLTTSKERVSRGLVLGPH